jgi:hypothetical protein
VLDLLADKLSSETSECMVYRRPRHRMLDARRGTPATVQTTIPDPWRMCFPDPAECGWTGIDDPTEEEQ